MKKGFTLSEMMITLAIVGVLSSLAIPVILRTADTSVRTLYKSAFKSTETVVNELVEDINLYSTGNFYNTTASYFCTNFSAKINIVGTANCTATGTTNPSFNTTNGMTWYGFANTFSTGNATIWVDVDGPSKGNNALTDDILKITIFDSGRMTTPNGNETNYLMQ